MDRNEFNLLYNFEKDANLRDLVYPLSGWKIYICGESEEDSKFIHSVLEDTILNYNLGWKSSKQKFFEVAKNSRKEKIAFFIYLPVKIVNESKHKNLVKEISNILINNDYDKDFSMVGSKKLTNSIYCRYEMDVPFREEGFCKEEYKKHYKRNKGNFNLENNLDIFE